MPKLLPRAALTSFLLAGGFAWEPGQAASHLLFKGFNVSDNCLEASVPGPPAGPVPARQLVLECTSVPFGDQDTLIYSIAEGRCTTLETFTTERVSYPGPVYIPNTSLTDTLAAVSDSRFQGDQNAFLQLEIETQELTQTGSTVCAPTGSGPPPDPDVLAQLDYLKAGNAGAGDNFGDQVAISGDTVVVGARFEDGSSTTVDGPDDNGSSNSGAAYVFVRNGLSADWSQQAYLKGSSLTSGDNFGSDVGIDGDTIVVAADLADNPTASGAVFVFVRDGLGWTEQAVLKASDAATSARFGRDVAVSGDTIVVGTFSGNKAYVFKRDPGTGQWAETHILTGSNTEPGDSFGRDVTIDGDTIVVGAFAEDSDATGVNGDGGNNNSFRSGAAYVFVRDGLNWTQQAYLKASNTDVEDQFGAELSLSGDTLVVGVYHESSAATGIDGDQFNNGLTDSGAAYVFVRDAGVWTQQAYIKASNTGRFDNFGTSVWISGDRMVIGAPREDSNSMDNQDDNSLADSGAVYAFVRDGATWSQTGYLKASNLEAGDWFSYDLGLSGAIMVSGAFFEDSGIVDDPADNSAADAGAAYVFNIPGGTGSGGGTGDCVPEDITLSSQAEVDSFQADHGPCDRVPGQLVVSGADITNLDGLSNLADVSRLQLIDNPQLDDLIGLSSVSEVSVIDLFNNASLTSVDGLGGDTTPGSITLWNNPLLGNLDAFSGVTELAGSLNVRGSNVLQDLDAFLNLTRVPGVVNIIDNAQLQSISGLANVTDFDGTWYIRDNPQLASLAGISGQPDLTGLVIWNNDALTHIDELTGLQSIGNQYAELVIRDNANLAHLDGLAGLVSVNAGLDLRDNPALGDCSALQTLLDDIDDASAGPGPGGAGIPDLNGDVNIANNLAGCNSLAEILTGADTEPPVVTAPPDIVGVEAVDLLTSVDLGTATVTDNSGETLTATPDNAGPFPIGDTTVTWSATDSAGNTGTDTQLVNIVDTTDPVVTAPPDVTTEATAVRTTVALGSAGATDNGGPVASLVNDAPGDGFQVGQTLVTWTATDASGNAGTDTQLVTITPPEILVPSTLREPIIDGDIDLGEWDDAASFDFTNGFAAFVHDDDRLYILIDMIGDDGNDPFSSGGGDQFWIHFDIDEDGSITPDVDLRYRLDSGTGNMRLQTYCDGCAFGFNPLEPRTFSARGEGFGCFIDDGTASFFPLQCESHRVWEVALDLAEVGMRADQSARFGMLVASGAPLYSENIPGDLEDFANYGLLMLEGTPRQAGGPPGPVAPLYEITQAVQTIDNALDLVADKSTGVRIWDENSESLVRTFVYGSRNGIDLPGSPSLTVSTLSGQSNGITRDSVTRNAFHTLAPRWSQAGTVDFEVLVQGLDDSIAASFASSMEFLPTRTPVFWTVPVRNDFPDGSFDQPRADWIGNAEQYLQRIAPIQQIDIVRRPELGVSNVTSSEQLKEILKNYDMLTVLAWVLGLVNNGTPPFDLPEQTTGFTATGLGDIDGSSDRVGKGGEGRITWARQSASSTSMTYAHELNHNLDRAQTSTWGLHSRGCDAQSGGPLDPSWPYGSSFTIQEAGIQPWGVRLVSIGDQTPDFMSYCRSSSSGATRWWSPYRWQAWVDEFRDDNRVPDAGGPLPPHEDSFYIQGRVYPDASGEFTQVLRQAGLPEAAGAPNAYTVQVLDCGANVLVEDSFDASFLGDEGEDEAFVSFARVLSAPMSSCSIELALDGQVLDTIVISANAPSVQVVSPNGSEVWTGVEPVQWTASDADGDDLTFSILLSPDNGMTWRPVAGMIEGTEYSLDSTQLPEIDQALIRVIASDGANTSFDDSDAPFFVLGRAPEAGIRFPADGSTVSPTHRLLLSGQGRTSDGEMAPAGNLLWSIDGMPIGYGAELPVFLDEGIHEIDLAWFDEGEVIAADSVTVTAGGAGDPGTIGFSNLQFTTREADGEAVLTVDRVGGAAGPAAVLFHTVDGTAISGGDPAQGEDDFLPVAELVENRIEWADGDSTQQSITIQINPDPLAEGEETFDVVLSALDSEQLGTSTATVVISTEIPEVLFADGFESSRGK